MKHPSKDCIQREVPRGFVKNPIKGLWEAPKHSSYTVGASKAPISQATNMLFEELSLIYMTVQ